MSEQHPLPHVGMVALSADTQKKKTVLGASGVQTPAFLGESITIEGLGVFISGGNDGFPLMGNP